MIYIFNFQINQQLQIINKKINQIQLIKIIEMQFKKAILILLVLVILVSMNPSSSVQARSLKANSSAAGKEQLRTDCAAPFASCKKKSCCVGGCTFGRCM
ncbi:transmembrane protein, putative (macronuclear) [Tetrahymena thermophila SB210]|uniref:Transmembrane protein, putative n=1 Tax=Tetrahymena thermophila (strain SB210) TaxID=312017 RepID=W7X903_TETTS|nr:transmembrane protein, putative [Tetrahymena thermophila SB210]EWS75875.1 transmembrane protein, putative [Tetrahymena thermophila SB210]|eukprot:XP_012651578.1 transmembrane protein, putative [Tetrahymena thermophila SB210]